MQKYSIIINKCVGSILSYFKKFGVISVTYAILLFIILYSLVLNPINVNELVKEIAKQQKVEHQESIDKRNLADSLLPNLLKDMTNRFNLDRSMILELHNGNQSNQGVAFQYISATYESIHIDEKDLDYVSDQYQRQRTSEYFQLLTKLKEIPYAYFNDISNYDGIFYDRLMKKISHNNTNSMMIIPLIKDNVIYGLLILSSKDKEIPHTTIYPMLENYLFEINKLLS